MITNNLNKIIILLLIGLSSSILAQTIDHWETIIKEGDSCMYYVPQSDIGTDWKKLNFDDSEWTKGESGIGYGDGDDNTILPNGTMSAYMRLYFEVLDTSHIASLILDMDYDDGFVAYLNGTEVARANVDDPISWDMNLNGLHEAQLYQGGEPQRFTLKNTLFTLIDTGKNVLAIEVHNESNTSSDLTSIPFLSAGITVSDSLYNPVPDWFNPSLVFSEFNLPLMIINTNGQQIPDEPRIVADMGIISHGPDSLNSLGDARNIYDGKISIEIRGESSSFFPKKSYSIELQNEDGSNNNVSILGLPAENDFVLYGPFSDKTMIKNVLTYELFRRTGRWAPKTRYIEIVLNNDYRGVYVLTEKLKRDDNRVDIDKITPEDVSPLDISGGYILRRDKTNDVPSAYWWESPVQQPYHQTMWYQYFDPEYPELTTEQADYIKNWMKEFDEMMSFPLFNNQRIGYIRYMDVKSFIDMMFINEISKGIDNYLFSTYFYKENDEDGGKLVAGPPWDYNLGYGNLNYGEDWDAKESYGWSYPQGGRVYWYERLMEDDVYRNKVYCRWNDFRNTIYSDQSMLSIIDSCISELGASIDRNYEKYPTLGEYLWPAIEPIPETYEGEIQNLKTWLIDRLAWMDSQWISSDAICSDPPEDIILSDNIILEDQPIGTPVGNLSTVDGDSDYHEYYIVSGPTVNSTDFIIDGDQLLSNREFDHQVQNAYTIKIESLDEANEQIEKEFNIFIGDVIPIGIDELNDISISVYPNPTRQNIQIVLNNNNSPSMSVKLYDVSGKLISVYNGYPEEINPELKVDSEKLRSGLYFINIEIKGISTTKKFMKL